jgi:putative ABC transport system permease protein
VALLACVVLIQSALLAQITTTAPRTAPAMVFTEIPGEARPPPSTPTSPASWSADAGHLSAPALRHRPDQRAEGPAVDKDKIKPGQRWAFDNDIGMTLLPGAPKAGETVGGRWWRPTTPDRPSWP